MDIHCHCIQSFKRHAIDQKKKDYKTKYICVITCNFQNFQNGQLTTNQRTIQRAYV